MLCNFDFLDLRPEDFGSFVSSIQGKVVLFVWHGADQGCICCDIMVMLGIYVL